MRRNETRDATTEPDARLAPKSNGKVSTLGCAVTAVMENRHGLAVAAMAPPATCTA
jgi:hypothetical protein